MQRVSGKQVSPNDHSPPRSDPSSRRGGLLLHDRDEEGTLRLLKTTQRDLIEPRVREHHGRIVKTTGDGFLIEFGSPLDAVRCALEVQEALSAHGGLGGSEEALRFRMGINLGTSSSRMTGTSTG